MPWEHLDHDADVAVRVTAPTFEDLLVEAARAACDVVGPPAEGAPGGCYAVALEAATPADLLQAWLSEVLFHLQTRRVRFASVAWRAVAPDPPRLLADVAGTLQPDGSCGRREVKGVTYHGLEVVSTPEGYAATVIFDV